MNEIYLPNLKSIEIKNFSLYPNGLDFKYNFINGVNLIFGGNGMGKTTFINLIKYGLIGLYSKDFGFRRTYQGAMIEKRLRIPYDYFSKRMDDSYPKNNLAELTITFELNKTIFEVKRNLYQARMDSVKIIENNNSYFLKGEIITQDKYDRLDESEKGRYLLNAYENKVVESSNLLGFDDLIFFINAVLFFDEEHTTFFWHDDETELQEKLSSKYFNQKSLDSERETARNLSKYFDSLSRHKSEDIRAINNVIKSIRDNETTNVELKNVLQEIEKTKAKINKNRKKLNSIHENREKLNDDRKIKNNDKNFIAKEIANLETKISDAEQKAYKQIWSKLNPKYKSHQDNIKLNGTCPMCNKPFNSSRLSYVINHDTNCFLCEQEIIVKEDVSKEINKFNSEIKPLLLKQQQIDAEIAKTREKIDDLNIEYKKYNQEMFEIESQLRGLEHALNNPETENKGNFEFKAMLAEIERLEIEKKDFQDKAVIEDEKIKKITDKIEEENKKITNRLSDIFSDFAEKFLGVKCMLTYDDFKDGKGKRFVPVINNKPRLFAEELSESQRFFVDHSYRMSLLSYFYRAPSFFACETPDSSLDISYERNAANVFLNYLKQPNALIITSNLNNSEFLEYIIEKADKIDYVNLLEIGRKSSIQESSMLLNKIVEKIKTKLNAKVN